MCGFGGSIWQLQRLVHTLNRAGYDVTALDFSKSVLSAGNPTLLPQLVDEVTVIAEQQASVAGPTLLVGVSLGSLLALNILRRSSMFTTGVLITGGDIAKIAKKLYPKVWPQPYGKLAAEWKNINIYTEPTDLRGKHMLFVVHESNKLIDTSDIYAEVARQQSAGNHLQLVVRDTFDHIGTIIEETIFFPKRTLTYIEQINAAEANHY